jgi:hypothetical protein
MLTRKAHGVIKPAEDNKARSRTQEDGNINMTALESEWDRLTAKNRKYDVDIVLRDLNDTRRYHKFSCMIA